MRKGNKRKADHTPEEWERVLQYRRDRRAANIEQERKYGREWQRKRRANDAAGSNAAARRQKRLRKGGFTDTAILAMQLLQNNRCALCRKPFESEPHADHDHATGKARGLLCKLCNLAEGLIAKIGVEPAQFGLNLEKYLRRPPASFIDWSKV